jgi:hypothetical protein
MEALGLGRREISEKDLRRMQIKNMDMRRDHITGTYIDPNRDIQIDEEYMDGLKKNEYLH